MIIVRPETAEDHAAVRRINELAFGRPGEAALVDALRAAARPHLSLVAESGGKLLGHIFFSPAFVEDDEGSAFDAFDAFGLGPMAVLPGYQRRGVGSLLVRRGLEESVRLGRDVVFVLGHADYYPRFGFETAAAKGLRCVYPVPDEAFMVAELRPGALGGRRGVVKYHPAFDDV